MEKVVINNFLLYIVRMEMPQFNAFHLQNEMTLGVINYDNQHIKSSKLGNLKCQTHFKFGFTICLVLD